MSKQTLNDSVNDRLQTQLGSYIFPTKNRCYFITPKLLSDNVNVIDRCLLIENGLMHASCPALATSDLDSL